jgi:hypothetical protein
VEFVEGESVREREFTQAKFKQLINEAINAKYAHALLTNSRAQPAWQEKLSVRGKEMTQIQTEFLTSASSLLSQLYYAKEIKFYSRTPGYSGRVSY